MKMKQILFTLLAAAVLSGSAGADDFTETGDFTVPAAGVTKVDFSNLSHTDLSYIGDDSLDSFSVHFERNVKGVDEDEFEEMLEYIDLDIISDGGKVRFELIHPGETSSGLFKRLFDRKEWRVKLKVEGPSSVDMEIDADFSNIRTNSTRGSLDINNGFGEARITDHTGSFKSDNEFGSVQCYGLDGSFDVNTDFGSVLVRMKTLMGESRADASFGNVRIEVPRGTGAEFHVDKSFGSVDFNTSGDVESSDEGRIRILNGGGVKVRLKSEFGDITVRDDAAGGERVETRETETMKERPKREAKPRFEEGVVVSVSISGTYLLEYSDVLKMLDIKEGERYTREEISGKVNSLSKKHAYIRYANFDIDTDGKLRVRVHEVEPHKKDFDLSASFSRIGGVGLGPQVTVNSIIGPVSEIKAAGQYHFSNSEWTYNIAAEKRLFNDVFALGGAYRLDYESSMDWAVPRDDSNLNALLFGLETKHFYQVEGASGFLRLKPLSWLNVKAEYFEDKFSSVKKHTNWSVFNHRHIKDDNLPLAEIDENRYVGMRARVTVRNRDRFHSGAVMLEAEQTIDKTHNTAGDFSRYFINAFNTWRLSYDNYLKIRLAGGYSDDALPAYRAFNLGGINTLRGFDYQSIPNGYPFDFQYGGNRMALCNVEYFLGDNDDVGFVVFADAGDIWMKGQDVNFDNVKRDIGVGITFDYDFFNIDESDFPILENDLDGLRINWAVPVGNVPHVSNWTVNFVQSF